MIPIIEVFGLPGSGKTHFVNEVRKYNHRGPAVHFLSSDELSLRGLKERDHGRNTNFIKKFPNCLWHAIINEDYSHQEFLDFASCNVELFKYIFSVLTTSKVPTKHYRSILGAFSRTIIAYELGSSSRQIAGEVLLADEWFCHRFYTLFGNSCVVPSKDQLVDYIRLIPFSDIIVFIATSPEECIQRMIQRDRFPVLLAGLSLDDRKRRLEKSFNSINQLSFMLKEHGRLVIDYNSSSVDQKRTIEAVLNHID